MIGYILLSVMIVSLLSFIGIFTLFFKKKFIHLLVSFAAGTLLAVAFLDMIPESANNLTVEPVFYSVLGGFFLFFILEKFFYWRHCHEAYCKEHPFTYLSLFGDSIHNFFDGIIIASAFLANISLGITTTIAVTSHEIPQELGDFAVLIHGGFSRKKAILWNFIISLTAFAGALIAFYFNNIIPLLSYAVPFAAGGFIYIAASDLIPQMHKEKSGKSAVLQIILFIIGIGIIAFLTKLL